MGRMIRILAWAGVLGIMAAQALPAGAGRDAVSSKIHDIWINLNKTKNACDEFDYFPQGGMRIFACHLKSLTSLEFLQEASGLVVFNQGPHKGTHLKLDHPYQFGYYNRDFVRWMVEHLVPGAEDASLRKATQAHYNKYVKPLATLFYATWQKAKKQPRCFRREVERYRSLMEQKRLPEMYYERFFFWMNPDFCTKADEGFDYFYQHGFDGGYDGNVVKTCIAFWMRRTIDGTADEFSRGLLKLLKTYDSGLLEAGVPAPAKQ
jgi:hypothetical protein